MLASLPALLTSPLDSRDYLFSLGYPRVRLHASIAPPGSMSSQHAEGVRLTGIDLSPPMLEIARKKTDELGVDADLRESDAQELPFPDASFDTVVCTLSLCNIP